MIPGMNKKQIEQAMKKLGIQEEPLDAVAVIIRTSSEDIIIREPTVSRVNMMGTWTYNVSGNEEHRTHTKEVTITQEDIDTVISQTHCTKKEAEDTLRKTEGDLAKAILIISGN
jgi:nascent polypeptide-associated complex subunit alpha